MSDHDSPTSQPVEPPVPSGDAVASSDTESRPTPEAPPLPGMAQPAAPTTDEPEVDLDFEPDGIDHAFDPNWVFSARLSGGIFVAVFGILSMVGLLIVVFVSDWTGRTVPLAFAGWLVLAGCFMAWSQIGPALHHKRRRYRLNETGLRIRRGLVFQAEISVPYSRIQHTDVSRGPIERSFGLATLIVHTAGTENASISVDGLPAARAYRIRDLLLADAESGDAV